jgi:hypothetical protein
VKWVEKVRAKRLAEEATADATATPEVVKPE